jgi:hypothetical protein
MKIPKFMVYAKGNTKRDDITIECNDDDDMKFYAQSCREQGYKLVTTSMDKKYLEESGDES